MLHRYVILFVIIFCSTLNANSIILSSDEEIKWLPVQDVSLTDGQKFSRLSFEGSVYNGMNPYPYYSQEYSVYTENAEITVELENAIYIAADSLETVILLDFNKPENSIKIKSSIVMSRKQPYASIYFSPFRWNDETKTIEKLVSFKLNIDIIEKVVQNNRSVEIVENSVLSNGSWHKIRVDQGGAYKLTYSQLQEMGFDVSQPASKIALYGNGGGILTEANSGFRHDDLVENPIKIIGGADGSFDAGDYIIFYGDRPVQWSYNYAKQNFYHENNYYDDYTYYFVGLKANGSGKRIQTAPLVTDPATVDVTTFDDYAFHEVDERNLAGSGRTWFGEVFDFNLNQTFTFNFPNVINSPGAAFKANLASKAYSSNQFLIYVNDQLIKTQSMPISLNNGYEYGRERVSEFEFTPKSDDLEIKLVYQRASSSSTGYLDYMDINVFRNLIFTGNQMHFRKVFDWETTETVEYKIGGSSEELTVWDISDPTNLIQMPTSFVSGKTTFKSLNDTLKEYIAINSSEFLIPEFVEEVGNQNLHALKNIDYLIIAHPDFLDEANRLGEFHSQNQELSVYVTTPQKIYNEFSSGSQDITAIRDFVKMLYDNSDAGKEIQYLLLFGDASYDYKDRVTDNTNFVPCWEHIQSLNIISSIASDDYFGYLDDSEGDSNANNRVDIGIGRFVVDTPEQGTRAVDKSINYCTNSLDNMGPWRNQITFVADDEDSNHHLHDAETLSSVIDENEKAYNVDKIYLDSYPQVSTPSGQRAPEVNKAINSKIEKGTLIFNYSGHGGELGLGHERIMEISDINSWNNTDKLPIFITATCEFSRYDDPRRVSAGELVFLNANGGAIALFTTARATFASSNLALNMAIYQNNLFDKIDGEYPRFGDVIRKSKKLGNDNDMKFVLLGDPAVRLAYPEYQTETLKINSQIVVQDTYDTIKALSKVVVEGIVVDDEGNKITDYDGLLYPTVYDKKVEIETLGTDAGSYPEKFYFWKSVLFNGKADIIGGEFEFEFVAPRDIAYNYGFGRISYYLNNETFDGHGYYSNIIIGGFDEDAIEDTEGPLISLFLNDDKFLNGDITDENPVLLAYVEDESGINTTGNGIGHDILAIIDDDPVQTYTLNEYYEAEVNRYNQGAINYPFFDLEDGEHVLSLRVWDIYNNSSTAYLNFIVTSSEELIISNLFNYPNPFVDNTFFVFEHNQSNKDIVVEIQIYSLDGRHMKTLNASVRSENYKSEPIEWDASTDAGGKIARGFYVYKLLATSESGQTKSETAKLVFIR